MNIHEYQAKDLLRAEGVPIPPGEVATTPEQAEAIAKKMGGMVVVKAQVHAGGRGKAGGVKLARTPAEAREVASRILGMQIKGLTVHKVLVTAAADIATEAYVGIILDRATKKPVFMVSPAGYYCETQTLSYCVPGGSAFKLPASSDYDLNLNVGGSTYYVSINGTSYGDGGFIAGGPTGLIEMTASGSTDTAYFTDYQLYQYK